MFEKPLQCVLYAVHITLFKIHVCKKKKVLFQSILLMLIIFSIFSTGKKGIISHGPLVINKIRQ